MMSVPRHIVFLFRAVFRSFIKSTHEMIRIFRTVSLFCLIGCEIPRTSAADTSPGRFFVYLPELAQHTKMAQTARLCRFRYEMFLLGRRCLLPLPCSIIRRSCFHTGSHE